MTTETADSTLVLEFDIPRGVLLTANQRIHWAAKARKTRHLRQLARYTAHRQVLDGRQRCTVLVRWPSRRVRDAANLHPTVKALIDGCVDAGLLPDDSDRWLIGPDVRPSDEPCLAILAAHLTFTFTPEPQGPTR